MKKIIIGLFLFQIISLNVISQTNARYGYRYPTDYGHPAGAVFRIFVVFAEVPDDTLSLNVPNWQKGKLPDYKNDFIDSVVSANYQTFTSRYYNEISFGKLHIVGNYYPHLLQIPFNLFDETPTTKRDGSDIAVIRELNRLCNGGQLPTTGGLEFPNDFDNWSPRTGLGVLRQNVPDGDVDCIVIVWRVNSKIGATRSGGHFHSDRYSEPISNKEGVFSIGCFYSDNYSTIPVHEIAHGFVGPNEYHTGNGAGMGTYLELHSGFGILSSGGFWYMPGYNAWDRYRLGWKNPQNQYQYEISALNENGLQVNTDLDYMQQTGDSVVYILRDFATTGDAVRIKLPYLRTLKPSAREQWIWIENHQLLSDKIEYVAHKHGANSPMFKVPRGIYFNIQVGNEDFSSSSFDNSRTNYIAPINKFGRFDFTTYTPFICVPNNNHATTMGETDDAHANPFTGVGIVSSHPFDTNGDGLIFTEERYGLGKVKYNGVVLGTEYFGFLQYSGFGSVFDAYYQGDKISISTNPAPNPLYTYKCKDRKLANKTPYTTPASDDNRRIYLNGLSIRVVEEIANGNAKDIKICIRWKDYDVKNNVRWCGDSIVLNEKVNLLSGNTILLDQGLTPVRPNNPKFFAGKNIFADPTLFICMQGSHFKANSGSTIHLKNNSTLVAESGSEIELDGANLLVESGSTLHIKSGATLRIKNSGNVYVKATGYLCIEQGATVILQDYNSVIRMGENATYGVNPLYLVSANCSSTITHSGNGSVVDLSLDVYIQNETITSNRYIGGRNIYVGHHVTTSKPQGNVLITNNANNNVNVVFDCQNIIFDTGFKCDLGASFKVVKQ